jgi:hypothetical protein
MSLEFTHKPNYFMHAQLIIHYISRHVEKQPHQNPAVFNLSDIYDLFRQDLASASTNLDGIMNIADEYKIETINGDRKIIQSYNIDAKANTLSIEFDVDALQSLANGKTPLAPDASIQG